VVVAGTVGEDEHSVGLKEILDIKHGGIERFGITYHYLGTSVPVDKLIDAAIETNAEAVLCSTIISHNDIHLKNLQKLADAAVEKGVRDRLILVGGGTQITNELALEAGVDAGLMWRLFSSRHGWKNARDHRRSGRGNRQHHDDRQCV